MHLIRPFVKQCLMASSACVFFYTSSVMAVDVVDFSKESPQLQVQKLREQNGEQRLEIQTLQQELMRLQGSIEQYVHRLAILETDVAALKAKAVQQVAPAPQPEVEEPQATLAPTVQSFAAASAQADAEAASVKPVVEKVAKKVEVAADNGGDLEAYQEAFNAIKAKKYKSAERQLKDYLTLFPQGEYAPNAHYWLGELNWISQKHKTASKYFSAVIKQYPSSVKYDDARYKMAIIHNRAGEHTKAKALLKLLNNNSKTKERIKKLSTAFWNKKYAN
ncbi:MAG: outer membrane protein assembly factor BamD [Pseudomonadota bacterium]